MNDRQIKVLIDNQAFMQRYGGVSRIFAELIRLSGVDRNEKVLMNAPLFFSENENLHQYNLVPNTNLNFIRKLKFRGKGKFINLINFQNKRLIIKALKKNEFDVFIVTYYDTYFLRYLNRPFVLTVYDMIHELFPEMFPNDETAENKKKLILTASRIIAISESTKTDILRLYPQISADKIDVIYLNDSIIPESQKLTLPEEYILFVGNRIKYKNFNLLLEAFLEIKLKYKALKLVCAGGAGFSRSEIKSIRSMNLANEVLQIDFRNNELYQFYKNAKLFVFPSLYEGFGIPVLEAMRSGCPCLLSNSSSLIEIGAQAAEYFDPCDKYDLIEKISRLLKDDSRRTKLAELGLIRAQQFSWEKTYQLYLEAISQSLNDA